tara:strand:+ start:2072 stop:2239 length:168 start_codon:yes stop_codon:yes gene_type:complete
MDSSLAKIQAQQEHMEEQAAKGKLGEEQQEMMMMGMMKEGLNLIWKLGKLEVRQQ